MIKRLFPPLMYVIAGVIIFVFLLLTINTYVIHLKVETAVVSAPVEELNTPLAGIIQTIYVTPGVQVKEGDVLAIIENPELEKEKQMARINVEDAKLNVMYYDNLLATEQQRLKVYQGVGLTRLDSAYASVNIAKEELALAKQQLLRLRNLHQKHYASDAQWESAIALFRTAQAKLKNAQAQAKLESHSIRSLDLGMYFTGNKLEGKAQDLKAELKIARTRLDLNKKRVDIYETYLSKLIIRAPFDAKVLQILKSKGNTIETTKPLLLLERTKANKEIIAYLTQSEINHLVLHTRVGIYIPALDRMYRGIIVNINRTSGFLDEVKAQFRWRDLYADRSAMATIAIIGDEQEAFDQEVASGMPAIVYFKKHFNLKV